MQEENVMSKRIRAASHAASLTLRLVLLEKLGRAIVTGKYPSDALDATLAEFFN